MQNKMDSLKKKLFAKDPTFRVLFTVGAGIAVILILMLLRHALCYVSTDDAFIEGHVVPISPRVSSYIAKVPVNDNQEVKAGDLLVELDPNDYQVRSTMAKAQLEAALAEAEQARTDVERYQALSETDEISKQQLDRAVLRAKTADAKVDQARAMVRQTDLDISYTKVLAPADGHVSKKSAEEGAFVQPGQVLMAIVPDEKWVVANFKETQLTHLRPGQPVEIRIDTYPGKKFRGRVDSIQRGTGASFSLLPPENATGNFVKVVQRVPVKIVFEKPPEKKYPLAVGMSVVPEVKVR